MIKSFNANLVQRSHLFTLVTSACVAGLLISWSTVPANAQQVLSGHVPHAVANSRALNPVATTKG